MQSYVLPLLSTTELIRFYGQAPAEVEAVIGRYGVMWVLGFMHRPE